VYIDILNWQWVKINPIHLLCNNDQIAETIQWVSSTCNYYRSNMYDGLICTKLYLLYVCQVSWREGGVFVNTLPLVTVFICQDCLLVRIYTVCELFILWFLCIFFNSWYTSILYRDFFLFFFLSFTMKILRFGLKLKKTN